MKTVVVYKSKTGFVKRYAEWIADDLEADIFEASEVNIDMLLDYETIIYGGGLYAVGINGVKLITENLDKLKGLNLVVFASGASSPKKDAIDDVISKNFTSHQQSKVKFFYLRGGFDYSKLSVLDKVLMTLLKLKLKLKRKASLTSDEKGMLNAYNRPVDFTKRENLSNLIQYVKLFKV